MALLPRVLLLALVTLFLAHAAAAGTEVSPEITDEQYDQKVTVNGSPSPAPTCGPAPPTSCVYIPVDIWSAWVEESVESLHVTINLAQAPPSSFGAITYEFGFSAGTISYAATATVNQAAPAGDGAVTAGGVASVAELAGTQLLMTVPKANIPAAVPGLNITQLYAASHATGGPTGEEAVSDRAPSSDYGRDFTMAAASNSTEDPTTTTSESSSSTTTGPQTGVTCYSGGPTTSSCLPPAASDTTTTTESKSSALGIIDAFAALGLAAVASRFRSSNER